MKNTGEITLSQPVFSEKTRPVHSSVIAYDVKFIVQKSLEDCSFIAHRPDVPRDQRISWDCTLKKRYLQRPDHADDTLHALRQYHHLDPTHALILLIPVEFNTDEKIRAAIAEKMRSHGLTTRSIEEFMDHRSDFYDQCVDICAEKYRQLSAEEQADPVGCAHLHDTYVNIPFPYIRLATREEDEVSLCIYADTNADAVYFAMATSFPVYLGDEMLIKAFLSGCIFYMMLKIEQYYAKQGKHCIDTETAVYFDFYEGANASLFLFINLQKYTD